MKIETHNIKNERIAELVSEKILINIIEDGLDLIGNLYFQGFDKLIIYEKNITPVFFDLKTGIAGEILQKCSNYRMKLRIIGEFDQYTSKSLKAFIYECNKGKLVNFRNFLSSALDESV